MTPMQITHVRRSAEDSFASGLHCAESVLLAIADAEGIESDFLSRIGTGFCGGMSRTCGTCGALTGAMMGIGLMLGRTQPNESVEPAYRATRKLIREFEERFGTRACHELLGCDLGTPEGQRFFRENTLSRRCAEFTGEAAEIAARILADGKPTA